MLDELNVGHEAWTDLSIYTYLGLYMAHLSFFLANMI